MKQTRKVYNQAFKERSVQLSYERDNISELARELDITPKQLYKWRKDLGTFGEESFPRKENLKQTLKVEKTHARKNIFCPKCYTDLGLPIGVENSQFLECYNCDKKFKNPYCKNKAKNSPNIPKKSKSTTILDNIISFSIVILITSFLVACTIWTLSWSNSNSSGSSKYDSTHSKSTTSYHTTQVTYVATSEETFHDMIKYFRVNDQEVINQLLYNGELIILPEGTELYLLGGNGVTYAIAREKGSTQKLWVIPQHISKN